MSEEQPWIEADVRVWSEGRDEYDLLAMFVATFEERDDDGESIEVGSIMGWVGWSVGEENIFDAADSVSADSAHIGYVASLALDKVRKSDPFVDDVLLLDRLYIEPAHRGRGLLSPMVRALVRTLRLHVAGCVVVAEPEPQRPDGGPYPDGEQRDAAMAGLVRSLAAAGLTHWPEDKAMWMLVIDG